MTDRIMNIEALPAYFTQVFNTSRVRIHADNRAMTIEPLKEILTAKKRSADILCGILADCPEMSVDKFLERMRTDAELDL
ncbi:MAG: hypothetical protein LBK23_04720 [Oscillospiraceae bacterium]|jgi:hypothetical protein|nr:hypothetical protein [Oscillospiraceae bacterium]